MSNPQDYTVGWICATATEYVAAQAFLDEIHDGPEFVATNDHNDYTLGKIGKHNIAVAVLPEGEPGTVSAASVARNMLHTFVNIRFGLMVGVGGGAPSAKHDIRLGDIVVSSNIGNSKGGVFQYDFGQTIQNQSFQTTGFLNQPPMILRTAVSGLKAQYELQGHQLGELLEKALKKNPRLRRRKKYQRPGQGSDRLFRSDVIHLQDDADCEGCARELKNMIQRPERDEDTDDPSIHYGLVASANQSMEDAVTRDKLANDGVLCCETEAAGLMNHFSCLVVRGICNYADTHKNDEWEGYAAMMAAAYAKDLLNRIPPSRVEAEGRIRDAISSMEQIVVDTNRKMDEWAGEFTRSQIKTWLSPPDPSTNYNKALQLRQLNTGNWFLQSHSFEAWQQRKNSFLWLHGIPGCGKTVLSASIIDLLKKQPDRILLYFYFDFSDIEKQSTQNLVRSSVLQLCTIEGSVQQPLKELYLKSEKGNHQPGYEALHETFLKMIEEKEIWIVVDALDECTTRKGPKTEGLLAWVESLLNYTQSNVHMLVTSRSEEDIHSAFRSMELDDYMISIQNNMVDEDICAYVQTRVREGDGLRRWRKHTDVQAEIETTIMQKANGMFRWAACQVDVLETCLDYLELSDALTSLPKTLDETYDRILEAIPREQKQTAIRLLQFLVYSGRPLTIPELVDAIAVREVEPYFVPKYRMPDPGEITRYCSSLIVMVPVNGPNGDDSQLQLAHFSVQEYLTSHRLDRNILQHFQEPSARERIASVCVAYLLHFKKELSSEDIREQFPFAQYSAQSWMAHARFCDITQGRLLDLMEQLLCYKKIPYNICYSIFRPYNWLQSARGGSPAPPLYQAVVGRLQAAVKMLLAKGAKINFHSKQLVSPLYTASYLGHEEMVRLLLDYDADINYLGGIAGSALHAAAGEGHEKVVKLLIERGADVNIETDAYAHVLTRASYWGHLPVVRILLEHGAKVNAQHESAGNALRAASFMGQTGVVMALLEWGADPNAWSEIDGGPLFAACTRCYEDTVRLLIDNGANVSANGLEFVEFSYYRYNERILDMLLDNGADVNAGGGTYHTPLCKAVYHGNEKAVKLLLERGADVNIQGGKYQNALGAAKAGRYDHIAKLLLERGATWVNTEIVSSDIDEGY